jgi:hypothetical protein
MTRAFSVYRRQDLIREICRALDYQGRFAWLVSTADVPVLSNKQSGTSRLKFRLLDISQEPYTFQKFSPSDHRKIKLSHDTTLTALPMLRSRRRDLMIFLHPARVNGRKWSIANSGKLSPEELAVLQGRDTFDVGTTSVAHAVCVYRGLVDQRGRPTELGTKLLERRKRVS